MSDPINREKEIFSQALEMDSAEARSAFVQGACGADHALRERVGSLVRAFEAAGGFIPTLSDLVGESQTLTTPVVLTEKTGDRIGRYKLLQQIGEGGCGVVYMAEQEEPVRRRVALKVIKLGMDTKLVINRFEAERQALAMMDHPNIAKVLDGGKTEAGRPYFVMELVRGTKITEYCEQQGLSTRERLILFIKVCEAIQHAHQKGIIHRDIKPSNILVTLHDGVAVPKVIDFGIAKATTDQRLSDKTLFTALGQFIGTPAYMSPEQAELSGLDIDTRCDIYSLGVLLYELLAGNTPFDAKELLAAGLDEMRRTIREKEPVRPSAKLSQTLVAATASSLNSAGGKPTGDEELHAASRRVQQLKETIALLRGDVDWIVMKCLEKDRARRYESANGLASDIQRHLSNETVLARPPSAVYHFRKMVRRNKLAFAAAAAIAAALVLGVIVSTWQMLRATDAKREAVAQRQSAVTSAREAVQAKEEAQLQRDVAVQQRKFRDMQLALQVWEDGDLRQANELIEASRPAPGQAPPFEWLYLRKLCRDQSIQTFGTTNHQHRSAQFHDSNRLLLNAENQLTLHDLAHRTNQLLLEDPDGISNPAFCTGNTNLIATTTDDGRIKVWDIQAKLVRYTFEENPRSQTDALTFSGDGRWLAVASSDHSVKVWDLEAKDSKPRTLHRYASMTSQVVFSSNGKHLFSGGSEPLIRTWNVDSGMEVGHPLEDHTSWVYALAISPDGLWLASGSSDNSIILWDLNTRQRMAKLFGHDAAIHALAFSPDQQTLASGARDGTIRLWDIKAGQQISVLHGHEGILKRLSFSPDGQRIVSQSTDGLVKLWKTRPALKDHTLLGGRILLKEVTLTRDGRYAAAIETANDNLGPWGMYVWNLSTGERTSIKGHSSMIVTAAFSPDGRILATGSHDQTVKLWDVPECKLVATLINAFPVGSLAFSPDGGTLIVGGSKLHFLVSDLGGLQFWDLQARHPTGTTPGSSNISQIALSANGSLLATGHQDGTVNLWNAQTRQHLHRFEGVSVGLVYSLAMSPTEPLLAAGDMGGNITLFNTTTMEVLRPPVKAHTARVYSLAFSPDGRTLASGGQGGGLKLWNVDMLQVALTLKANGQSVAFAQHTNLMATSGGDGSSGTVQLWPAATLEEADAAPK